MGGVDGLLKALFAAYEVKCKQCGSGDVVFNVEEGVDYGDMTGYSPGVTTVGCNACKKNDIVEWI